MTRESNESRRMIVLVADILRHTSSVFDVPVADILGPDRSLRELLPRQAIFFLARQLTPMSYPELGRRLNRHHTSIIHGVGVCPERIKRDPAYAAKVWEVGLLACGGRIFINTAAEPSPLDVGASIRPAPVPEHIRGKELERHRNEEAARWLEAVKHESFIGADLDEVTANVQAHYCAGRDCLEVR